jgi:hypothetical protein
LHGSLGHLAVDVLLAKLFEGFLRDGKMLNVEPLKAAFDDYDF